MIPWNYRCKGKAPVILFNQPLYLAHMALHRETLKTRSLTAAVFVVVMLGGLLGGRWPFIALMTLIHFGCWYEYLKLQKHIHGGSWMREAWLGIVYISAPIAALVLLYHEAQTPVANHPGLTPILLLIASIWINDTMAYIVGSLIGKTPLSPVSPKKTWEGTLGGALLAVLLVGGFTLWQLQPVTILVAFTLPALAASLGTIGDLYESSLKRRAGVKDSGHFMPGHGGFLDRFDSLLFASVPIWLFLWLVQR